MPLFQLADSVLSRITNSGALRRTSSVSKETFAHDISLVALSIRTGYLVDSIYIPEQIAEQSYSLLLNDLQTMSEYFKNVIHLYEPCANKTFFINKLLLIAKLDHLIEHRTSDSYPVFVHLAEKGPPFELDAVPSSLMKVLHFLRNSLTTGRSPGTTASIQLPQNLSFTTLVPLAAILLDYPIAYVPGSENQMAFLSDTPLILYRCHIEMQEPSSEGKDEKKQHVLLQCSCPSSLAGNAATSAGRERTVSHLENTFGARIVQALPSSVLHIDYEHVTLDRVAL